MKLKWWHIGLIICLAVALLSPLASGAPTGLDTVAEDKGFIDKALEPPYQIIPDYVFPGVGNEAAATIIAGIIGTLLLFAIGYGLAWLLRSRTKSET